MSRQTDKEEREAAEREAEEKAKAKAKAKAEHGKDDEAPGHNKPTPKTTDEPGEEATKPSQLQPYPYGSPPDPEDEFEKMHGFRRVPPESAKEK